MSTATTSKPAPIHSAHVLVNEAERFSSFCIVATRSAYANHYCNLNPVTFWGCSFPSDLPEEQAASRAKSEGYATTFLDCCPRGSILYASRPGAFDGRFYPIGERV